MERDNVYFLLYIERKYMIYFSDLDRTLIYSEKFIREDKRQVPIEILEGREISYISNETINLLKRILLERKFIPTTTRSIEQFKRIQFAKYGIDFEYSIVTNGGNILYKGEILNEYTEVVKERLKSCTDLEETMKFFCKNYGETQGITKIRSVDGIFFYIVVNRESFDEHCLDEFEKTLDNFNWKLYTNGRKMYFIPSVITKEAAIEFLLEYLCEKKFTALGDSIMDLNMLMVADKSYIPANSYLLQDNENHNAYVSENEGFEGTEEILKQILIFNLDII